MIDTSPTPVPREQPNVADSYDVAVVGGGPAGSTVAALVAEAGYRVLLCERSDVPRFHVGESLIPECWHTLNRLGMVEQLNAAPFPKKHSVQFVTETGKESAPFYFQQHRDHPSSTTWQVERGVFDLMLLDNCAGKGAVVRTDAQVLDVPMEDGRATGVRVKLGRGDGAVTRTIESRVVVDASGQSAFLASRLGLKQSDPHLKKATVWTYFRGAQRDPGIDEGATLILQTEGKKSWFWYIPLPDDIVSVGCTGSLEDMFGEGGTAREVFDRELARCPGMLRRVEQATRHADCFTTKDYSWSSTAGAGEGWVLVGDAHSFIDPVYSSGVFLALKSGELAADAIVDGLRKNDLGAEQLGRWRDDYNSGVEMFRRLVYAFYTPGFSFGRFLKEHPQHHGHLVDVLIGDVFKPEIAAMFDDMGEVVPPARVSG